MDSRITILTRASCHTGDSRSVFGHDGQGHAITRKPGHAEFDGCAGQVDIDSHRTEDRCAFGQPQLQGLRCRCQFGGQAGRGAGIVRDPFLTQGFSDRSGVVQAPQQTRKPRCRKDRAETGKRRAIRQGKPLADMDIGLCGQPKSLGFARIGMAGFQVQNLT